MKWHMPIIPTTWEVEIRRSVVWGQPGQKVRDLHLNKQARYDGVCVCGPNYEKDYGPKLDLGKKSP
jgi:hypothetical protein